MSEMWHADPGDIARYSANSIDATRAVSIEVHLVTCAHGREQVAGVADQTRLDATWVEIVDSVESPSATVVERIVRRMGVRAEPGCWLPPRRCRHRG